MSLFRSFLARVNNLLRPDAGDAIHGTVTGSQNVAVGKQITQHIYQGSPPSTAAASGELWTQQDIDRYLAHMRALYATTRILGKTTPVSLEGIYTDVYILDKLTARQRFSIEELKRRFLLRFDSAESNRQNGLELVKQSLNLFILGKPGAGKTTFLRYIALQAAQSNVNKLPIFVTLKEWQPDHQGLMPLILKNFEQCDFPNAQGFIEQLLRTRKVILLFDGLDEVNQEQNQRHQLVQQIVEFSERYHRCQYLITCRIAASDYQFPRFQEVEVADFNREQIHTYIRNWFRDNGKKGNAFFAEFYKPEHEGLRELATIPLLLSLLCLIFEDGMAFPLRRSELYKEAIDVLLKKWDSARNIRRDTIYRGLSTDLKQQMFASIAMESFDKGEYFFTQEFLKERIEFYIIKLPPIDRDGNLDGIQILRDIESQHSILVERASEIYSFSHLTLQEYFSARYIVDHGAIHRLLTHNHIADARWQEVILLTASLLPNADDFFKQFSNVINSFIFKDEQLAALLCWAEGKAITVATHYQSLAVRAIYIYLATDRSLASALTLALTLDPILSSDLHVSYTHERNLKLDRYLEREFNSDFALDLAPRLAPALALDLALVLALTRLITRTRDFVRDFTLAVNRSRTRASKLGLIKLDEALSTLQIPREEQSADAWDSFIRQLRTIMVMHRNIGTDWQLSKQKRDVLNTYLKANLLLIKCLDVAYVSNRQAIKDSLLLPPQSASSPVGEA